MSRYKNNYQNQLELIEGDNVNVGKESDIKSFFILIVWIAVIIGAVIFTVDFAADIYISKMPDEKQIRIESIFKTRKEDVKIDSKYAGKIKKLDNLKQKIIQADKKLQNKSDFTIRTIYSSDVNAGIMPDGTMFFTTAALDADFSEQEYAFILAHELGHYVHRDHLRTLSRELAIYFISTLAGRTGEAGAVIKSISSIQGLSYSRSQEKNADLYAGEMLKKIYGTNQGGISFIKKLKQNEKNPDFLYYFASHPSWSIRLKLLEKQNKPPA